MTQSEIQQTVAEFLAREIDPDTPALSIDADTPLLDDVLDFPGVLRLVVFLEEHFQIDVGGTELRRDNFATIERIADYVDRRTKAA